MSKTTDMTQGKPLGLITSFALPLMVGNIFQQLYNMVDSIVVGRFIGVDAFAAVGAAGFFSWMVIDIILGFTQGFGILFAQRFGAKNEDGLRRSVATAVLLCLGLGVLLTAGGLLAAGPVLTLVNTPAEIRPGALLYLQWIFSGTLITMAYNITATLLRALGNSKAPLYGMFISMPLNIVLDILFVCVFHMGISGVAIATLIAQLAAFLYCFWKLSAIAVIHLSGKDFSIEWGTVKELLRLGSPLGFRNAVISAGGLFVQSAINSYGRLFVAGTTAAMKYFGMAEIVSGALDGAFATFSAQNFGAGNFSRIKSGMRCARRIALISVAIIMAFIVIFGRPLISLLVSGTPEEMAEVTTVGYQNLLCIAACLPMLNLLYLYRSGLQGMGNTLIPMLSGFTELLLRIAAVLLLPLFIGRWGIYFAYGLGWIGAALLLCISYYRIFRKLQRRAEQTEAGGS